MANNLDGLFESFLNKYEIDYVLEKLTTIFFIETPEWIKNKKSTINPQSNDNKCFQYSVTLSLYHNQIKRNLFRISEIKRYVNNIN